MWTVVIFEKKWQSDKTTIVSVALVVTKGISQIATKRISKIMTKGISKIVTEETGEC